MRDWDKLRLFNIVAESGSLSEAARRLNISQPALSRQIRALEDELGNKLFHRHARGTVLSHDGRMLFERTNRFSHALEGTLRAFSESGETARGKLTVTVTLSFGTQWLVPRLPAFYAAYPDVELELALSDMDLPVGEGEAEMAIRFHQGAHADDIQRAFLPIAHRLYASPIYLQEAGTPECIADLDDHRIVTYGPLVSNPIRDINWILDFERPAGSPRKAVLTVNNVHGVLRAVRAGIGIAALPDYIVGTATGVVPVLPDVMGPTFQSYLVYPSAFKNAKRIKAFRDFLFEQAAKESF